MNCFSKPEWQISDLKQAYQDLLADQPGLRIRKAAASLGVSELELLLCDLIEWQPEDFQAWCLPLITNPEASKSQCLLTDEEHNRLTDSHCQQLATIKKSHIHAHLDHFPKVLRIPVEVEGLLPFLQSSGELMALTRNDSMVHERKGIYQNFSFSRHGKMAMGLCVNEDIDLRLFLNHWHYSFLVVEGKADKKRISLQFFSEEGVAVHKIYCTEKSEPGLLIAVAMNQWLTQSKEKGWHCWEDLNIEPKEIQPILMSDFPVLEGEAQAAMIEKWDTMKDIHHFIALLKKHKVDRLQAFQTAGPERARRLEKDNIESILTGVRDAQIELMCFVGNLGCIQIHTGLIKNLVWYQHWYNVLDKAFNLHIDTNTIDSIWLSIRPSTDGLVHSIDFFNDRREVLMTLFGKRKEGMSEMTQWRDFARALV